MHRYVQIRIGKSREEGRKKEAAGEREGKGKRAKKQEAGKGEQGIGVRANTPPQLRCNSLQSSTCQNSH